MRADLFARADKNADGVVTREEAEQGRRRFRERLTGSAKTPLEQADLNGDGQVTREEFLNAPRPLFERADTNGDGRLTEAEFGGFIDQLRAMR
jgi:Ca2+-binding EF-hand superfamily protein